MHLSLGCTSFNARSPDCFAHLCGGLDSIAIDVSFCAGYAHSLCVLACSAPPPSLLGLGRAGSSGSLAKKGSRVAFPLGARAPDQGKGVPAGSRTAGGIPSLDPMPGSRADTGSSAATNSALASPGVRAGVHVSAGTAAAAVVAGSGAAATWVTPAEQEAVAEAVGSQTDGASSKKRVRRCTDAPAGAGSGVWDQSGAGADLAANKRLRGESNASPSVEGEEEISAVECCRRSWCCSLYGSCSCCWYVFLEVKLRGYGSAHLEDWVDFGRGVFARPLP